MGKNGEKSWPNGEDMTKPMSLNRAAYSVNGAVLLGQRLTRSLATARLSGPLADASGGRPEVLKSRGEASASPLGKGE